MTRSKIDPITQTIERIVEEEARAIERFLEEEEREGSISRLIEKVLAEGRPIALHVTEATWPRSA